MSVVTLTRNGQIVIPARIRARYGLKAGTRIEFVDEGGVIRLRVRPRVAASDLGAGFGMFRVKAPEDGKTRRLADFDARVVLHGSRRAGGRK